MLRCGPPAHEVVEPVGDIWHPSAVGWSDLRVMEHPDQTTNGRRMPILNVSCRITCDTRSRLTDGALVATEGVGRPALPYRFRNRPNRAGYKQRPNNSTIETAGRQVFNRNFLREHILWLGGGG